MSGHSKWATIKHKKAATDAKRGAAFTKIIREITTIARNGGGDPTTNAALRGAMDRAKAVNMPLSNVENAIKKGTGELEGVSYEEVVFDAYGPSGVAMLITGLTDNKNRTTAELRNILNKKNGNMANPGSTSFLFSKKGFISVEKSKISEDDLMGIVLDAGAEDLQPEGEYYEVFCPIDALQAVKDALNAKAIPMVTAEMTMIPSTRVSVTGNDVKALMNLIDALEENEDVQNVYANFDISDEEMEKLAG